ncbi:hypothetical protein IMG5_099200 [Ichthyophthirius multifiliis]|uniref:Uncharacterized protein n=1 Tax=Ichthyophthirius multifiliis TaxID=5932 RepID=G0QS45_ICHMU|nr:hypothetical protein IMG5_099200 [Ichthyophthirius multifiliis]EGR31958.1 hypothetical protein IMG5_099200 [Ichthyophthirius multifiliis]|eukprot:XP_004035444.1 hypothetical protein IMG5_099200 [Ichthyophthirius multifiliis]
MNENQSILPPPNSNALPEISITPFQPPSGDKKQPLLNGTPTHTSIGIPPPPSISLPPIFVNSMAPPPPPGGLLPPPPPGGLQPPQKSVGLPKDTAILAPQSNLLINTPEIIQSEIKPQETIESTKKQSKAPVLPQTQSQEQNTVENNQKSQENNLEENNQTAIENNNEPPEHLKIYMNMIKYKIPKIAVKQKMVAEGYDPDEIDQYIQKKI